MLDYPAVELSDSVVRLRRWESRDLECVRLAATDSRIPRGTTVPAIYTEAEGRAFIERQHRRQEDGEGLSFCIEPKATGAAAGLIAALRRPQPGVVGLGYWIIPGERCRGYAAHAICLLAPWLLTDGAAGRVEALVTPDNGPSARSLESCGFQAEGVLRSYLDGTHDVVVYSLVGSDVAT